MAPPPRFSRLLALLPGALLLLISHPLPAAPQTLPAASPPPAPATLSPAAQSALHALRDTDFAAREQALASLRAALAAQVTAMLQTRDPEVESRLAGLLEFQSGLMRWANDLLKLPPDQRDHVLAFGTRPEILPLVASIYADRPAARREAVRGLAKVDGPFATDLIAARVNDTDRGVYVAAMEALWDRPPTDAAVDALWHRAVAAGVAVYGRQTAQKGDPILFRGRLVGEEILNDNAAYRSAQDHAIACEVLEHLRAPQVTDKLLKMLAHVETVYKGAAGARGAAPVGAGGPVGTNIWMYAGSQEPMKNFARLVVAYKPTEAVPGLFRIATGPVVQRSQGQVNGIKYFWSNRTWALALLLELTGRPPGDLKLAKQSLVGGMWTAPSEAEEEAAVTEIKKWWGENSEKWTQKATTRPEK